MGDKRMEHNMDDVVETVKNAKERGKKCTLLIGAGCSVTAGIPTAKGFVEIIEKDYTRAFKRAKTKTYAHCMAELSLGKGAISSHRLLIKRELTGRILPLLNS